MKHSIYVLLTLMLLLCFSAHGQQANQVKRSSTVHSVRLTILDEESKPMPFVVCNIKALGLTGVSDSKGLVTFSKVPEGEAEIQATFIGYEPFSKLFTVKGDVVYTIKMVETSLNLTEVTVVARKNAAGESTGSQIQRQAIDHLQSTNLQNLMELIPGQIIKNQDLTLKSTIQLRSAKDDDKLNSFGTAVIVDGVPMSSNADMNTSGSSITQAAVGIDARQVETDNVESVEVIRGIPSAEYGDLTSGAVIVNTKAGLSPWQIRAKVNPATVNTSINKGFKLGNKLGSLNTSFDYAQSWGDPRSKNNSFDRITGSVTYSKVFAKTFTTKTRLRYASVIDWRGNDPDEVKAGIKDNEMQNITIGITHDGRWGLNKKLARTISYTIGATAIKNDSWESGMVNISGVKQLLLEKKSGYYEVPFLYKSYDAKGGTISKPLNLYAKLGNSFYFNILNTRNTIKMGVEYRYEKNRGIGKYNENPLQPRYPNIERLRKPNEEPALRQLSAYAEDHVRVKLGSRSLILQAGVRFTALQPGMEEQVWSLDPRVNASINLLKWLDLRAGYGINSKTPGLMHLYPERSFNDRVAGKYETADIAKNIYLYHVNVKDVESMTNLKNVQNTKYELGADIKLGEGRSIGIVAFMDKTKNGFEVMTSDIVTYQANYYNSSSLAIGADGNLHFDLNKPAGSNYIFSNTGRLTNSFNSTSKGIEVDMNLGRFDAINTSVALTGAYTETKSWTSQQDIRNPEGLLSSQKDIFGEPVYIFKLEYSKDGKYNIDRRFSTILRVIHNIPQMGLVASVSLMNSWYTYSYNPDPIQAPKAWFDYDGGGNVQRHEVTQEMLLDPNFAIHGVLLKDQTSGKLANYPTKQAATWLISSRLSKSISNFATFSFFVNNTLFYEPYLRSTSGGVKSELSQRNTGSFSFGIELLFTL